MEGASRHAKLHRVDAPKPTIVRARGLRRALTPPEARLWRALRRKALDLRFRRQHPIGPYVLDFYCDALRLAVEVDGAAHRVADNPQGDARRDAWLAARGIRTLRIPAADVRDNLDGVLAMIRECATG